MAKWETLENHTVDFRGSEDFTAWRGLVGQYFAAPPEVEHTETVLNEPTRITPLSSRVSALGRLFFEPLMPCRISDVGHDCRAQPAWSVVQSK